MAEQATDYRVVILEGPNVGTAIQLAGRALPYPGVAYEVEQRVKTTYYPGNPIATQQVMGAVDKPTTINGIWKDTFLGDGVAQQLVRTFEDLCRSGVLVEVQWGDAILPDGQPRDAVVRRGILKRFKPTYDRPQDIAWEAEFEWRGRDEATAPPLTSAGVINNRSGFQDTSDRLSGFSTVLEAFDTDAFNQLAGFEQRVSDAFDDAQVKMAAAIGFLDTTTDAIESPTELSLDIIERTRGVVIAAAQSLSNLVDAVLSIDEMTLEVKDSALGLLELRSQFLDIFRSADTARESCNQNDASLASYEVPEVLAEVRVPAGTDLRDLARQFYSDPELWWLIADYNNLSSSRVPDLPNGVSDNPARPILIPRRGEGQTGDISRATC